MKTGSVSARVRRWLLPVLALCAPVLAACASLVPAPAPPVQRYRLALAPMTSAPAPPSGPVLLVDPPAAVPGLEGRGMAYVQRPYRLAYFARHGWVAPPARMLEPLLVEVLQHAAGFRAVPAALGGIAAGLRLDTRILALQQEFTTHPSRERVVVQAWLSDPRSGRLLAERVFEAVEPAPGNDPYSGVQAANRAVARILAELAAFCRTRVRRAAAAPRAARAAGRGARANAGAR